MNWICATCGKPNGGSGRCPDCGQACPDYGAQRALLGPVLNVNYGVINYNLAPTLLVESPPAPSEAPPALPPARMARSALATIGLLVLGTVATLVVFFALLAAVV